MCIYEGFQLIIFLSLQTNSAPYLLIVSVPSTLFFGILGYVKLRYARLLKSSALALDGLSSGLFSMFSFCMLLSTLLTNRNPALWWLDPFIALILALTCIAISTDVLYEAVVALGIPCFRCSYWSSDDYYNERKGEFQYSSIELFEIE